MHHRNGKNMMDANEEIPVTTQGRDTSVSVGGQGERAGPPRQSASDCSVRPVGDQAGVLEINTGKDDDTAMNKENDKEGREGTREREVEVFRGKRALARTPTKLSVGKEYRDRAMSVPELWTLVGALPEQPGKMPKSWQREQEVRDLGSPSSPAVDPEFRWEEKENRPVKKRRADSPAVVATKRRNSLDEITKALYERFKKRLKTIQRDVGRMNKEMTNNTKKEIKELMASVNIAVADITTDKMWVNAEPNKCQHR